MRYILMIALFYVGAKFAHEVGVTWGYQKNIWMYALMLVVAYTSLGVALMLIAATKEYWEE